MLIENLIGILQNGTPLADLTVTDMTATVKPHLASTLASRVHLMGQISLFNLVTAVTALQIGVPGRLTIEIPSRVGGRIEVSWRPARTTPK